MDTILNNAVLSIQVGLEDYQQKTLERSLSSVRNVYAGMLLLFKEKLRRLSPPGSEESLVKEKIEPKTDSNGEVIFIGTGKRTVTIHQIKERFNSLQVHVDWERLDKVSRIRNDIEHYQSDESPEGVRELLADVFVIISKFVKGELEEEPYNLFGKDTWRALLNVNRVYREERESCIKAIKQFKWSNEKIGQIASDLRCKCGSNLLVPEGGGTTTDFSDVSFKCKACARVSNSTDLLTKLIADFELTVVTKGGDNGC